MAVALQGLHQGGDRFLKPFAAEPVRSLPENDQGLPDGLTVETGPGPCRQRMVARVGPGAFEHPHGVLTVKTGHFDQFVQNLLLLRPRAGVIPLGHRFDQFASGRHLELLRHVVARPV
jgi:hypothetical protein